MKNSKPNPFKGINTFCRVCRKKCKQFENVIVIYCPSLKHIAKKHKSQND